MYTVYKTVNLVNGKYYIGVHKSDNPHDDYLGSGKLIKRAIKKYGKGSFKKEVIAVFENREDAYALEFELVVICDESYNLKLGGEGGFDYLNDSSPQHLDRAKRAASKGGTKASEILWRRYREDEAFKHELSLKLSTSIRQYYVDGGSSSTGFTGKRHNTKTKELMSIAASDRVGDKNSQFGSIWITNGAINKKIQSCEQIPAGFYRGRFIHKSIDKSSACDIIHS